MTDNSDNTYCRNIRSEPPKTPVQRFDNLEVSAIGIFLLEADGLLSVQLGRIGFFTPIALDAVNQRR